VVVKLKGQLEKEFISITAFLKKKWSQISKQWAMKDGLNCKELHKNLGGLVQHVLSLFAREGSQTTPQ